MQQGWAIVGLLLVVALATLVEKFCGEPPPEPGWTEEEIEAMGQEWQI